MHKLINDIPVWGEPLGDAVRQIQVCRETAVQVALMADHHVGYSMPIGGVAAYRDKVSPSGVGFDIACGNKAVRVDADPQWVKDNIGGIMDEIFHTISFGVGRKNKEAFDHPLLHDDPAWDIPVAAALKDLAHDQLGTVGSGNHYVDIFEDEAGAIWIGVHFGSRGLGHKLATHFLKAAGGKEGIHVPPTLIPAKSTLGQEYIACMKLAGRYAYAGRDWVCQRVADILGAKILEEVHNHHNFAWREEHGGEELWVVRKGATPAFPGQRGFIGGSMGDNSVIVEGIQAGEANLSLYSTVHGAGRVMSRTRASGKTRWKHGRKVHTTHGEISRQMMLDWVNKKGVVLRGAGTDESPHCYKRLAEVLAFHSESLRILHTLRPLGVAMAGEDEWDPYKD
jgi:tRNA-splicing ligase RtcB